MRLGARSLPGIVGALVICLVVAPAAVAASCPTTTNAKAFASASQLRKLVRQENQFGERYLASRAHDRTIGWIKDELRAIDGFKVRSDPFKVWTWLPRAKAKGRPGLALERAGALRVSGRTVPVAGAVRWSKPTEKNGQTGPLVYLAADQDITAANSAGKVVVRDFPGTALPYAAFGIIGVYVTPDLANATRSLRAPVPRTSCTRSCSRRAGPAPRESSSPSTWRASRCAATATRTRARSSGCRRSSSAARRRSG